MKHREGRCEVYFCEKCQENIKDVARKGQKELASKEELAKRVDEIIAMSDDDEGAHSAEDDLHRMLLKQYLPPTLFEEIERLNNADFERWCA